MHIGGASQQLITPVKYFPRLIRYKYAAPAPSLRAVRASEQEGARCPEAQRHSPAGQPAASSASAPTGIWDRSIATRGLFALVRPVPAQPILIPHVRHGKRQGAPAAAARAATHRFFFGHLFLTSSFLRSDPMAFCMLCLSFSSYCSCSLLAQMVAAAGSPGRCCSTSPRCPPPAPSRPWPPWRGAGSAGGPRARRRRPRPCPKCPGSGWPSPAAWRTSRSSRTTSVSHLLPIFF